MFHIWQFHLVGTTNDFEHISINFALFFCFATHMRLQVIVYKKYVRGFPVLQTFVANASSFSCFALLVLFSI